MQLFYAPEIEEGRCVLSEEESWHCVKVLRLSPGSELDLTDGAGNFFHGVLEEVHSKRCEARITSFVTVPRNPWHLHIAIAPTKSNERFEWFLEKATEIGIDEITPLLCEHSERVTLKLPRMEKVLVAAMKQSLRAWLPVLNEPVSFRQFITREMSGQKFIGYCETGVESELHDLFLPATDAVILIGPEGDFSKTEVEQAVKSGITPITLGPGRLRTETAGVVACTTVGLLNRTKQ
jgi:16S rRNA (uracil1498-N3)-methyltransferase